MKERVISGVFIAVFSVLFCYFGGIYLASVLTILSLIAYYELTKAIGVLQDGKKVNGLLLVGYAGILAYYGVLYFIKDFEIMLMVMLGVIIATMFVYVVTYPKYESKQIMSSVFAFIYGPVLLSFMLLVRTYSNELDTENYNIGFFFVWFIIISAWISDTCAYFVGVLFGKHKIFPKLSPKKTFEGCFGGVCGSTLGFLAYGLVLKHFGIIENEVLIMFICLGVVGSVVAQIGDLTASAIKRNNNIKDYGNLIPGHGGIMDRFDSIIFVSPLVYIMISLFFRIL